MTDKTVRAKARTGWVVGVLSLSGVVVALQQTLVVPVLPAFATASGVSSATASWLVTSTLLTGAVATPLIGRLADMFGKRAMMLVCLAVMIVGCMVAALSQSFWLLILGRSLQGFATALLPVGISIMRDVLPPEKLSGAVALMSATLGIGGMFGMPMAGVISAHWGLPALFWVTGGFGVVLIVVLPLVVPESAVKSRGRFDFLGATVLTLAMTALLLAVSKGTEWGWASPEVLVLIASGVVLLCGWIPWELHTPAPLVDLRTSLRAPILVSNVCAVLLGFAMFISALAATQELQLPLASADGLGLSAAEAGLAMMPGGILMIGLAPVSSKVTRRWGAKATLASGAIVIAIGYVLRVLLAPTLVNIVIGAAVVSAGVAFSLAAMPTLITESAPIHQTASANGFNSLLRSVGTSTGSAVAAAVLASSTVVIGASTVPTLHSFAVLYWIGAGVSALAAAVTLAVRVERTGAVSLPELPIAAETDGATKIG
ncbi:MULTISPECIES: MFS transporter [Rhodococcus erythropolis group]|uniref:MFS transporter n=1 Tax=Rhodococcus baikonurensis TaxID=172041 RepID=A0ABV5XLY8_9NOCA|nr:MFS transporter [Rhodococcus erythropolis]PBI97313.1 Multidrug export protein EmrB [Rhodococcus erythropolis]UJC76876.1 MFS transporter [Rhodococcus erythropolis]